MEDAGFLAKFILSGKSYNVVDCNPSFNELIDHTGEILVSESNGQIKLFLDLTEIEELQVLMMWFNDDNLPKIGTIIFYKKGETESQQYTIEFSSAFCIQYKVSFSHKHEEIIKVSFTMNAQHIEMSKIDFNNLIKF